MALHRPDYVRAPKIQKPSVARVIVRAIRNGDPPGRFLRKDEKTGKWIDIGDKKAAEKTSQALREKTNEEKEHSSVEAATYQSLVPIVPVPVPVPVIPPPNKTELKKGQPEDPTREEKDVKPEGKTKGKEDNDGEDMVVDSEKSELPRFETIEI